jgi:hypothetical protein
MPTPQKIEVPPAAKVDPERQVAGVERPEPVATVAAPAMPAPTETVNLDTPGDEVTRVDPKKDNSNEAAVTSNLPCPHCGIPADMAQSIIQPDDVDKKRWLRHLLGEARFTKEYAVIVGQEIKVQLRSRTVAENDAIMAQLTEEVNSGLLPAEPLVNNPQYMMRMHKLMLAVSLCRLIPAHQEEYLAVTADNYPPINSLDKRRPVIRAYDALLSNLPLGLLNILVEKLRMFESVCYTLSIRGYDVNFWQ